MKKSTAKTIATTMSSRELRREYRLGPIQLLVIEAILELGSKASGLEIRDHVNARLPADRPVDPGAIYMTLRRLLVDREFVEVIETRRVRSSPPLKIYAVKSEGEKALAFARDERDAMHKALKRHA